MLYVLVMQISVNIYVALMMTTAHRSHARLQIYHITIETNVKTRGHSGFE